MLRACLLLLLLAALVASVPTDSRAQQALNPAAGRLRPAVHSHGPSSETGASYIQLRASSSKTAAKTQRSTKAEAKSKSGSHAEDAAVHHPFRPSAVSISHHHAAKAQPQPLRIDLSRTELASKSKAQTLLSLKMRQKLRRGQSLLEAQDVPLQEEVLREKHLATYYGVVSVAKSKFRVLFDTGSCEFWVPSSECSTERCLRHHRFPVTDSVRFKLDEEAELSIEYLSGKVAGSVMRESVVVGGVTVKQQAVGVANVVDIALLDDVIWDGIVGLAYPNEALTTEGVSPLFDSMIEQGALTQRGLANQFAYYIDDDKGSMTFGGADCSLLKPGASRDSCISSFQFVPVSKQTYWTVSLRDVRVRYPNEQRERSSGLCGQGDGEGCDAIVDTGTYLVYGPENQVLQMLDTDLGSCADYAELPDLIFDFKVPEGQAPVVLRLRPIDYVLKFRVDGRDECVMGVSPDRDTMWTLGQVFLRSFYTLFDRDANRIGFARIPRDSFNAIGGPEKDREREAFRSLRMAEDLRDDDDDDQ